MPDGKGIVAALHFDPVTKLGGVYAVATFRGGARQKLVEARLGLGQGDAILWPARARDTGHHGR